MSENLANPNASTPQKQTHFIGWEKPKLTQFKMNADGAVSSNNKIAGIGVVIRTEHGEFKTALESNIVVASNVTAELWAIRNGLILARNE